MVIKRSNPYCVRLTRTVYDYRSTLLRSSLANAPMVDQLDEEFVRVLESHRGVPAAKALIPIRDPTFGVLTCVQDEPFFVQMVEVLNTDPQQVRVTSTERAGRDLWILQ